MSIKDLPCHFISFTPCIHRAVLLLLAEKIMFIWPGHLVSKMFKSGNLKELQWVALLSRFGEGGLGDGTKNDLLLSKLS